MVYTCRVSAAASETPGAHGLDTASGGSRPWNLGSPASHADQVLTAESRRLVWADIGLRAPSLVSDEYQAVFDQTKGTPLIWCDVLEGFSMNKTFLPPPVRARRHPNEGLVRSFSSVQAVFFCRANYLWPAKDPNVDSQPGNIAAVRSGPDKSFEALFANVLTTDRPMISLAKRMDLSSGANTVV